MDVDPPDFEDELRAKEDDFFLEPHDCVDFFVIANLQDRTDLDSLSQAQIGSQHMITTR